MARRWRDALALGASSVYRDSWGFVEAVEAMRSRRRRNWRSHAPAAKLHIAMALRIVEAKKGKCHGAALRNLEKARKIRRVRGAVRKRRRS